MPISPTFLITHRTALKDKVVRVRGVIVGAVNTEAGVSGGHVPGANANPQPRIFRADSARKERDKSYDLMVLLREGDVKYRVGATVEITGTVETGRAAVYLRKNY